MAANQKQVPLRTREVARNLGVSDRAVRLWITTGISGKRLAAMRAGDTGDFLIRPADLEAFLNYS